MFIPCTLKTLPRHLWLTAAARAVAMNPANRPRVLGQSGLEPEHIALLTSCYWGTGGVRLSVGFLDNPGTDLRSRIISHMNAWGLSANVQFGETAGDPAHAQVRIARAEDGYWSYLGTDILHVPAGEATMNLEGFTMQTPESEFARVVRHETGHTLGFPHEHLRADLVARIDPQKAYTYFGGPPNSWTRQMVDDNVLTPLNPAELRVATSTSDVLSIMCYQLPGSITKDGQPITGGNDIDAEDAAFAGAIYPKPNAPPPLKPPVVDDGSFTLTFPRDIAKGGRVSFAAVRPIHAGVYTVAPKGPVSADVEAEATL